jgi:hypothetical protein
LRGAVVPDFRYRAGEDEETELGFSLLTFLWFYLMVGKQRNGRSKPYIRLNSSDLSDCNDCMLF